MLKIRSTPASALAGAVAQFTPMMEESRPVAAQLGRLRTAAAEDAAAIALVHLETRRATYQGLLPESELTMRDSDIERFTRDWRERISGEAMPLVLVLEDARGAVVGFAAAGLNEAGAEFPCELYSIYLLAAAQRLGGGRRLFEAVVDHFRRRGAPSLAVWVLERNPARGFYEAMGGTLVSRRTLNLGGVQLEELAYLWQLAEPQRQGLRPP